jgi:hypothetical protein
MPALEPVTNATLPSRRKLSRTAMTPSYCFCGLNLYWLRQPFLRSSTEAAQNAVTLLCPIDFPPSSTVTL